MTGHKIARRSALGLLAGAATLAVAGCGDNSVSYRFRMTVEVETPQGLRSGSSVMEVRLARGMAIGDQSGVTSGVFGEAVVVDLPDGPLFVLLQVPDAGPPLQSVVPRALLGRRSDGPDGVMADGEKLGSTWFSEYRAELPRADWPLMVRFGDISDPKTVEQVDPDTIGVKRILLETTRDDVTTGIEKRLGWLPTVNGSLTRRLASPDPANPPFSARVHGRDFSTEIKHVK